MITIVAFIVNLGILIFVHELGHFLACRIFGIQVETFSLGFGKRLWGFRRGEVDYRISLIPLGGYVKMAGENDFAIPPSSPDEFRARPRWQRMIVMLAGALMNIILAVGLVTVNYMSGIESPIYLNEPARAGMILPDSAAAEAGLQPGDTILTLAGQPVPTWTNFQMEAVTHANQPVSITIRRNDQVLEKKITFRESLESPTEITGVLPFVPVIVETVREGFPAARCGLQKGDVIQSITDGRETVNEWFGTSRLINRSTGKELELKVLRGGTVLTVRATPVPSPDPKNAGQGVLGFERVIPRETQVYSLGPAFLRSLEENKEFTLLTYRLLWRMITLRLSFKQLSGPLGIAKASGVAAESGDPIVIFGFMALISMNLAIINLLPIPILDGGMIFLLLIESLFRRDLPPIVKERAYQAGFVLLMMLMSTVIVMDIMKTAGWMK